MGSEIIIWATWCLRILPGPLWSNRRELLRNQSGVSDKQSLLRFNWELCPMHCLQSHFRKSFHLSRSLSSDQESIWRNYQSFSWRSHFKRNEEGKTLRVKSVWVQLLWEEGWCLQRNKICFFSLDLILPTKALWHKPSNVSPDEDKSARFVSLCVKHESLPSGLW